MGVAARLRNYCALSTASTPTAMLCSPLTNRVFNWSGSTFLCTGAKFATSSSQRTSAGREEKVVIAASQRRANLSVRKKERVPLPTLSDPTGMPQHLSVFLQQPAGTQSMLNTKALQKCEYLGDDVFRCFLPKLTLLNFEVAPIVDLFVAASDIDCQVEMRSCMFSGSKAVEDQNDRFSASLRNHLTWQYTSEGDQVLDLDTELKVSLEVYTVPFTMLPLSAVEVPGNAIMQAMLDRLIPLFLDHLFVDYKKWVDEEALKVNLPMNTGNLPDSSLTSNDVPDCLHSLEISS